MFQGTPVAMLTLPSTGRLHGGHPLPTWTQAEDFSFCGRPRVGENCWDCGIVASQVETGQNPGENKQTTFCVDTFNYNVNDDATTNLEQWGVPYVL